MVTLPILQNPPASSTSLHSETRSVPQRHLKFLLISPTAPEWRVAEGSKPKKTTQLFRYCMLSNLYVAASTPDWVQTRILDEDIEPVDFQTDADIIGLSFMTFNAPRAYEIADRFRSAGKTVIMGGFHPSFLPDEALQHSDAVCVGEAESSVPRMMEDFSAGRLKGIYRSTPAPLKGLPVPDRTLIRKSRYNIVEAVQATRGCPHRCTFCSITSFFGHTFRTRPIDEVIEEISALGKHLLFMDDNLTYDADHAKELFRRMIPLKKRWFSQTSTQIAQDDELLDLAARSGCRGLFIGFESLSQAGLKGLKKEFNTAGSFGENVRKIHSHGIGICAAIVLGNDFDTTSVFRETLDFLLDANIDAMQATIMTPFPGTPLFDELDQQGRIIDKDWAHYDFRHVVFEPKNLSREELKEGHDWLLTKFYSWRSIARRFARELAYMKPSAILTAPTPMNLSYRVRLTADGTFAGGHKSRNWA
jgi:radical SAM superfamily enzyme YgiQ (UPF0313 family)